MTGRRYGRLTVLADLPSSPGQKKSRVQAICDCGVTKTFTSADLRSGNSTSCGCLAQALTGERSRKHGLTRTPIYRSWMEMRARCLRPTNQSYANYGGRGISVCERWRDSFEAFAHDMGPRPSGTTLDRIDNNKGYEPGNCRWATPAEQARNRRSNILATINGETKCLYDWCLQMDLNYEMVCYWVRRRGLSPEQALQKAGT